MRLVKNLHFRGIPDEVYFGLIQWKGKLKAKDNRDFARKLLETLNKRNNINKRKNKI